MARPFGRCDTLYTKDSLGTITRFNKFY